MWSENSNQTGVLDVTIQCQLNMATRNIQEMTTNITPTAGVGHRVVGPSEPSALEVQRNDTNYLGSCRSINAQRSTQSYENITPTKSFSSCEFAPDGNFTNVFMTPRSAFQSVNSSVKSGQTVNCKANSSPPFWNNYTNEQQCNFLNDSGYGSPGSVNSPDFTRSSCSQVSSNNGITMGSDQTSGYIPQNFYVGSIGYDQQLSASCTFRNSFGTTFIIPPRSEESPRTYGQNYCATQNNSGNEFMDDDMKIAMKEKDVTQRIYVLKSKGYESAQEVEDFYQQQTTLIDIERHNILRQMAYDKVSSESINSYYNRKLLSILENVDHKLSELENSKTKCKQSQKKSRLLPKAAVKILESWYQENLSNPYPSREVTLTMASEGGITVEQIRKWFANKRNRSRNSKLKASDADANE